MMQKLAQFTDIRVALVVGGLSLQSQVRQVAVSGPTAAKPQLPALIWAHPVPFNPALAPWAIQSRTRPLLGAGRRAACHA